MLLKKQLVILGGLIFAAASAVYAQVPVVLYHAHVNMSFSSAMFQEHMDFLKDNHFSTITPDQLLNWMENGDPLPFRPVMVTFDDNYEGVYTQAYQILKANGQCAVNFAHTDYVDGSGKCTWAQIQLMEDEGVFYTESHTRTHPHLPELADTQQWDEIGNSKLAIDTNMTNKNCQYLAYPYGQYDATSIQYCETANYRAAFNTVQALTYRSTPVYEIPRYSVDGNTLSSFKGKVQFTSMPALPGDGWTVDNKDPNFFVDSGSWVDSTYNSGYYHTNYSYSVAGTGEASVQWKFPIPKDGSYRIYVRWTSATNRATNAKYNVTDSSGVSSFTVNQKLNGSSWQNLGSFAYTQGDVALVALSNDADGVVVADAVWIEPLEPAEVGDWELY